MHQICISEYDLTKLFFSSIIHTACMHSTKYDEVNCTYKFWDLLWKFQCSILRQVTLLYIKFAGLYLACKIRSHKSLYSFAIHVLLTIQEMWYLWHYRKIRDEERVTQRSLSTEQKLIHSRVSWRFPSTHRRSKRSATVNCRAPGLLNGVYYGFTVIPMEQSEKFKGNFYILPCLDAVSLSTDSSSVDPLL